MIYNGLFLLSFFIKKAVHFGKIQKYDIIYLCMLNLKEGMMKSGGLFLFIGLLFCFSAHAKNIEFEVGKLISEIDVQEMDLLRNTGVARVNKLVSLVEETVFMPAIASVAKSINEEDGTVDKSYCLLNLNTQEVENKVLEEYRAGNIEPTDGYIAMGVTLAIEKCGVIEKEDRRSLYEVFKKTMMTGVVDYSYPDWQEEVHVKSRYY